MKIEDLPLELRLKLGIVNFVESQQTINHQCNVRFHDHGDPQEPYHFAIGLLGEDGHFLGAMRRDENGDFIEPVYLDLQSTPMGGLYEKFKEFITRAPYSISVEIEK